MSVVDVLKFEVVWWIDIGCLCMFNEDVVFCFLECGFFVVIDGVGGEVGGDVGV